MGCLMYLTTTRHDILHYVSLLSRFTNCATETHFTIAKRVLRHVKRIRDYGIGFCASQDSVLKGYFDNDWGGSSNDMKSIVGYYFKLGLRMFSWCSKKQNTLAQSTVEAEFIAATSIANQALWLRNVLIDLNMKQGHT